MIYTENIKPPNFGFFPNSVWNYSQRFSALESQLSNFGHLMGLKNKVELRIRRCCENASANSRQSRVNVPSWFLFKPEDIPLQFRISSIDDPRLDDENFLASFGRWIEGTLAQAGLEPVGCVHDSLVLQQVVLLLRHPELFEKAKSFVLAHELSHVVYFKGNAIGRVGSIDKMALGSIVTGVLLFFMGLGIMPVVTKATSLFIGGTAAALATIGTGLLACRSKSFRMLSGIEQEKKADLDAARALGTASGGI